MGVASGTTQVVQHKVTLYLAFPRARNGVLYVVQSRGDAPRGRGPLPQSAKRKAAKRPSGARAHTLLDRSG